MTGLIIFDLDGTLIDTPTAIVEAFTAAFATMGVPDPGPAAVRATIGLPLERAFGELLGVSPDHPRAVEGVRRYGEMFRTMILPRASGLVFPDVVAGLSTLRARGLLLAVATSKFRASADAILAAAGLLDWFDLVVGVDEVPRPKPDPAMAEFVLGRTGVPADRAVMVGDTTHDLLMARAAGLRSVAVTYGVHGVDLLRACEPTWMVDAFPHVVRTVCDALAVVAPEGR